MRISVRLFASHRERLGTDRLVVDVPPEASLAELIATIAVRFPGLGDLLGGARCAVNREYAAPTTILHEGDEVALIPPVAGGGG